MKQIIEAYAAFVLTNSRYFLLGFLVLLVAAAVGLKGFRLDASAESLLLENDQALKDFREVNRTFGSEDEFLVVAYTPKGDLFSEQGLQRLRDLRDDLVKVSGIGPTNSILNVPLLHSPELSLDTVDDALLTLDEDEVAPQTAKQALLDNPLYPELLLSQDAKTTAIQVFIETPEVIPQLLERRNRLRQLVQEAPTRSLKIELADVEQQYIDRTEELKVERDALIERVRAVLDTHRVHGDIFLGGIPMIAVDMINFIQDDIVTFGIGVLLFLIITLWLIFRQWRWVVVPLLCCSFTVLLVAGYLGWRSWPVTVISSNFISLLLIMTLSLTIHLIVRYREIQQLQPGAPAADTLKQTLMAMITPCFFMVVTTVVAFSSFTLSGILPVIDFGWMMTLGLIIAFVITFVVFPSLLSRISPPPLSQKTTQERTPVTAYFAILTQKRLYSVLVFAAIVVALSVVGISRLTVENSFVDYFKESTDIYQGMVTIDQELGGTTPLDIVITDEAKPEGFDEQVEDNCDPFVSDCGAAAEYRDTWFTYEKMDTIASIHNYLDSLDATGKVISVKTTIDLITQINQNRPLKDFELEFVPKRTPATLNDILLTPYISEETKQARLTVRLRDSLPGLRRNELLQEINAHIVNQLQIPQERVLLSGMMVMYNNMLQSLFESQIKTLGFVFLAISLTFMLLFRSFTLALIGMMPNVASAVVLLGTQGALGIPLDFMTITVAAITIGIAVDDTIHYIHRFKQEVAKDGDYLAAMHRCHRSIGKAMFYTTLTIIMGFSILVLSNFLPSIYFGLFTGFAMFVALFFALTLLPALIVVIKPFGTNPSHAMQPAAA